jgi:hypothetical protein
MFIKAMRRSELLKQAGYKTASDSLSERSFHSCNTGGVHISDRKSRPASELRNPHGAGAPAEVEETAHAISVTRHGAADARSSFA